ncbi:MAG: glycosyltransferase family 39 protein [Chloroflexota bacterium]
MSEKTGMMNWITEPTRRTDIWLGALVFVFAVVVSWVFWSLLPAAYQENQSTDYTSFYEPVARNIAQGLGVTLDGEIATRYPPGFPMLLAGAFKVGDAVGVNADAALVWFRLLCAGLSAVFVFAMARLVWLPMAALVAALAWATYPFGLWLTKQPNSEVAFIPLMFAAIYLLWRALLRAPRNGWLYLASGVLAGAAMLVRPAGIGLGVVFAVLVLLFAGRSMGWLTKIGLALLILVGNLLIVLPWQGSVYARTGEFIPLSSGGAITIKDGLTFLAIPKEYRREVAVPEDVETMMQTFQSRRDEMSSIGDVVSVVLEEAAHDPVAFAKIVWIKATRSWYGIDSRQFEGPTLALQIIYLGLAVWGSWYAWRMGGDLRRMITGNWLIVGYFWAMTMLVVPLLRYTLPVMGLLMVALPGVYYSLAGMLGRQTAPTTQILNSDT